MAKIIYNNSSNVYRQKPVTKSTLFGKTNIFGYQWTFKDLHLEWK